jgi:hypothetical protein
MVWQRFKWWITSPWRKYKQRKLLEQRIKELRDRDPFIYK